MSPRSKTTSLALRCFAPFNVFNVEIKFGAQYLHSFHNKFKHSLKSFKFAVCTYDYFTWIILINGHCRTISEVEQPRGAQFRPCGVQSAQINTSPAVVGYSTVSLLRCPDTPFIDPTEANVESTPQLDSTNLVCASVASSNTSPSTSGQAPDAVHNGGRCE